MFGLLSFEDIEFVANPIYVGRSVYTEKIFWLMLPYEFEFIGRNGAMLIIDEGI